MKLETLNKIDSLFKNLYPNKDIISSLYDECVSEKAEVNKLFGLTEENHYRQEIDISLTEEDFIKMYPHTYNGIKRIIKYNSSEDYDFSISKNEVYSKNGEVFGKLSKFIPNYFLDDRLLNKIYLEIGRNDTSIIFDIIKPKKLVISTNLYDILTSSTNSSFTSCYSLIGSHFNGNIAYARDSFTMIVYTYSDNIERKNGRCFIYTFPKSERIVISRFYGSMYVSEKNILETYLKQTINPNKEWTLTDKSYSGTYYRNARPCYDLPNAIYFDESYTKLLYTKNSNLPKLLFKISICLYCGNNTRNGRYGACSNCQELFTSCNSCGEVMHKTLSVRYGNKYICNTCYETRFTPCGYCDTKYSTNDMIRIPSGEYWCKSCVKKYYRSCSICNTLHKGKYVYKEHSLCKKCKSDYIFACENCHNDILLYPEGIASGKLFNIDGKRICKDCYIKSLHHKAFTGEFPIRESIESYVLGSDTSTANIYPPERGSLAVMDTSTSQIYIDNPEMVTNAPMYYVYADRIR